MVLGDLLYKETGDGIGGEKLAVALDLPFFCSCPLSHLTSLYFLFPVPSYFSYSLFFYPWPLLSTDTLFLFFKINLFIFIYLFLAALGLCCCTLAFFSCGKRGLLRCSAQAPHCGGFSCCGARALGSRASAVVAHRLSSCGARAYLLRGMWDLPGPGLKPMSPALAGVFSTTAPPGKSRHFIS